MKFTERNREATAALVDALAKFGDEAGHRHGWKSDVARRLGIRLSTLSHIINGGRVVSARTCADYLAILSATNATPTMARAQAIADRVGMPVAALVDGWILAGVERAEKALS